MKRIIFLVSLLVISGMAGAQVKFGLKFSPHLTWISTDNKNTTSNGARINLSYGLMMDYYFTENYAFATEFGVTTFGGNLKLPASGYTKISYGGVDYPNTTDLAYDYRMQYITIPLLIRMRTKEIGYLRYYAEFGLGMGFLLRSKADVSFAGKTISNMNVNEPDESDRFEIEDKKYSDRVNSMRFSLIVGAGIQYNMFGNTLLVAGLRYDNGLNSFTKDDRWNSSLNFISLNTGVLF